MTALYDIAEEYRLAAAQLADLDLDDQTLADTLESLSGDLEVKAYNIAAFSRNLEATAEAIKDAESKMAARRKAIENRSAGLKRYLLGALQHAGVSKIETPYFVLAVRDNPAAVEVYEPGLIPANFMRQPDPPPPAVDKTAIKEALKAGQDVPGCKLTVGKRLEIK